VPDDAAHLGVWQPLQPQEAAALFAPLRAPWWIAGGWALDLFLGVQTREHGDLDVQILRRDQRAVREALSGWDMQGALPAPRPEGWPFREWRRGEELDPAIHDVWCRRDPTAPWSLQLMVAESDGDDWLFRRDPRIRRRLDSIGRWSDDAIPYLAPEIQLLYKAKAPRAKDEEDFAMVAPRLDRDARRWLCEALATAYPAHPWRAALDK
jgi:hypothetical protein